MNRHQHTAKAREMLGYADALDAEERGSHTDLSLLLEANAHAVLALLEAVSELTEQASPTEGTLHVRAMAEVTP